jgi:hypothetical protein
MRRISVVMLGGCAVLAAGAALATSSAFAAVEALPKLGRCVPMAGHGEWIGKKCEQRSPTGKGSYKWLEGAEAGKNKFTAEFEGLKEGAPLELQTANGAHLIRCQTALIDNEVGSGGEYTGSTSQKATVLGIGCGLVATQQSCHTSPSPTLESEIELSTEGSLGFIKGIEKLIVGWDLKVSEAVITCGNVSELPAKEPITDKFEGSVIGALKPLGVAATEMQQLYKSVGGKQNPEKFENGARDVLMSTFGVTGSPEQTGLIARQKITNEQALEIKTKCIEHKLPCT